MTDNWASDIRARIAAQRSAEEKRRLGLLSEGACGCTGANCTAWIGSLRVPDVGADKCVMPPMYEYGQANYSPGFYSFFDWIRGSVT